MNFEKTIAWYDKHARSYANNTHKVVFRTEIQRFLVGLGEHPKVLDAGCGAGRDAQSLAHAGADVVGVDLSKGLLGEARKKYPEISFVEGDLRSLPFQDASFKGVWAQASLVHLDTIEDVEQVLSEFFRVLQPSGRLHIVVKEQIGSSKTEVVSDHLSDNSKRFFRYYQKDELTTLLQKAGFIVDDSHIKEDVHGRSSVRWLNVSARIP